MPKMLKTKGYMGSSGHPLHTQASEGSSSKNATIPHRSPYVMMYEAAIKNNWSIAEVVLKQNPSLVWVQLTEKGDRALHVAAAMQHKDFMGKLLSVMSPDHLLLHDGHGYTAFCYVAKSGLVDAAAIMRQKNGNVVAIRTKNNLTPIYIAAAHGNREMVSYLQEFTRLEDLSTQEWFDLLLTTIRGQMYDVALKILEMNGSLATISNDDGTALHVLAREHQYTSKFEVIIDKLLQLCSGLEKIFGRYLIRKKAWLTLFDKLWTEIEILGPVNAHELMKKPPIIHEAAKVGNIELITKLTCRDPDILWDTDSNGHTVFHIAVLYRQEAIFKLIHQIGLMKDFITISTDEDGNNILHLAGKLAHPSRMNIVPEPALQMKRELSWFKKVETILPPSCLKMRNKDGYLPRELFSKEHKSLLEESKTWMKETTNSCRFMITIMITMVFNAAFTVPGGFHGETGIPILLNRAGFKSFLRSEALAMFFSTLGIIMFWSIQTSSFQENEFRVSLPTKLTLGLLGQFGSLLGTMAAFISTLSLVFFGEGAWLENGFAGFAFATLLLALSTRWLKLLFDTYYSESWTNMSRRKHTLF